MTDKPYYSPVLQKIAEVGILVGSFFGTGVFIYNTGFEKGIAYEQSKLEHVIGPDSYVTINGEKHLARIDTGATTSSIDFDFYKQGFGTAVGKRTVTNPNGKEERIFVQGTVEIQGKEYTTLFSLNDRKERGLTYPILIGRDGLLDTGILVDTSRPHIDNNIRSELSPLEEKDLEFLEDLRN